MRSKLSEDLELVVTTEPYLLLDVQFSLRYSLLQPWAINYFHGEALSSVYVSHLVHLAIGACQIRKKEVPDPRRAPNT